MRVELEEAMETVAVARIWTNNSSRRCAESCDFAVAHDHSVAVQQRHGDVARDDLADVVDHIAAHPTVSQSQALIVLIEQYAAAQPNTELEDVISSFLLTEAKK